MDEQTRRLERQAMEDGGPETRVRLARSFLRSAQYDRALEAVSELVTAGASAVRTESFLHTDRLEEAADEAGAAVQGGAVLDAGLLTDLAERIYDAASTEGVDWLRALRRCARLGEPAAELLRPLAGDDDLLVRAQVAWVPSLAEGLRDDPSPLVRHIAQGAPEVAEFPRESAPTRLFSAHGPDFDVGRCIAFRASCQARLLYFDGSLFEAVSKLLGPGERVVAMGLGYCLAIPSRAPLGDLEERIEAVNAASVLPFELQFSPYQPFDNLEDPGVEGIRFPIDERLARRFARDLSQHPANLGAAGSEYVFCRILEKFKPGHEPPPVVDDLLVEAKAVYGGVGYRALELFVERAGANSKAAGEVRPQRRRHHP